MFLKYAQLFVVYLNNRILFRDETLAISAGSEAWRGHVTEKILKGGKNLTDLVIIPEDMHNAKDTEKKSILMMTLKITLEVVTLSHDYISIG